MDHLNTYYVIKLLIKNWKKMAIVAAFAIGISVLITAPFIMTPDYRSEFTLYPTNLVPFSRESTTEQLFQFLTSEEVKNNVAKRFDLYKHYEIDSTSKNALKEFNSTYSSNVQVKFTRYQSAEVYVIDRSPEFAQRLAFGIIEEINTLIRKRKKEKYLEYVELYQKQLVAKKTEIDSIEGRLKFMRLTYGLLDVKAQTKNVTKNSGKKELNASDKALLNNLKEFGGEFTILQSRFGVELENYKFLKQAYDKNVLELNSNLSYVTVVSPPNFPDKKNSPKRTLTLLFITFSSLLLAAIAIIYTDKKAK